MTLEEGVLVVTLAQSIEGSPSQGWEYVNCVYDVYEHLGRSYPMITRVDFSIRFSSEGRRILRLIENGEHFSVHGIISKSMAMKAMVKFLMILVPQHKFKEDVFLNEDNARKWMLGQLQERGDTLVAVEELQGLSLSINDSERALGIEEEVGESQ